MRKTVIATRSSEVEAKVQTCDREIIGAPTRMVKRGLDVLGKPLRHDCLFASFLYCLAGRTP